jgi:hypothetical protein
VQAVLYCTVQCPATHYSRLEQMVTKRSTTALVDAVQLLGLALSVPIAILIIGAPIALAVAFLLWVARMVVGSS